MTETVRCGQQGAARDWKVVTPSRYATKLHDLFVAQARQQAQQAAAIMARYPGVVVAVNVGIEQELAKGGESDDGLLGDYRFRICPSLPHNQCTS